VQVNKGAVAAVAVMGAVTGLVAGIVTGVKNCKEASDTIVEGGRSLKLRDHTGKLGYQHSVSALPPCDRVADCLPSTIAVRGCLHYQ